MGGSSDCGHMGVVLLDSNADTQCGTEGSKQILCFRLHLGIKVIAILFYCHSHDIVITSH